MSDVLIVTIIFLLGALAFVYTDLKYSLMDDKQS